jgi:hypothetical protein
MSLEVMRQRERAASDRRRRRATVGQRKIQRLSATSGDGQISLGVKAGGLNPSHDQELPGLERQWRRRRGVKLQR